MVCLCPCLPRTVVCWASWPPSWLPMTFLHALLDLGLRFLFFQSMNLYLLRSSFHSPSTTWIFVFICEKFLVWLFVLFSNLSQVFLRRDELTILLALWSCACCVSVRILLRWSGRVSLSVSNMVTLSITSVVRERWR